MQGEVWLACVKCAGRLTFVRLTNLPSRSQIQKNPDWGARRCLRALPKTRIVSNENALEASASKEWPRRSHKVAPGHYGCLIRPRRTIFSRPPALSARRQAAAEEARSLAARPCRRRIESAFHPENRRRSRYARQSRSGYPARSHRATHGESLRSRSQGSTGRHFG